MDKNLLGTNAKSRTISYLFALSNRSLYFSSVNWFSGCLWRVFWFFGYNVGLEWKPGGKFSGRLSAIR